MVFSTRPWFVTFAFLLLAVQVSVAPVWGGDWPMWRCDSARSGETSDVVPAEMQLLWTRQLPALKPTYCEPRLQFDAGYEPVVLGKMMFVAFSHDDSVAAYDTETGNLKWKYFAEGPVRLAPAAWQDRVFFGSDDGCLYCVNAEDGQLQWKFQAVPSERKVLGNGRLISVWPVRGGPVLHEGRVYFAAGVWPFEGVFIYALEATTGEVVWRNDESGYLYGQHPHAAEALGGVTPQGYLVINGDELIVPCGQALPARYDLATGKLLAFELPRPGRRPGGWFASADVRRGEVVLDAETNSDLHEDKVYQGPGETGVRKKIRAGDRAFQFGDGYPGVEGEIHTMLAADGKLFVVTLDGMICAFGAHESNEVVRHPLIPRQGLEKSEVSHAAAVQILKAAVDSREEEISGKKGEGDAKRHGYAVVLGLDDASIVDMLMESTVYHVVGIDSDAETIAGLRRRYADCGLYGNRVALLRSDAKRLDLPPYMANLLVVADSWPATGVEQGKRFGLFEMLRPYAGVAALRLSEEEHAKLVSEDTPGDPFAVTRVGGLTVVRRKGGLPGSANYTGGWVSEEAGVRAPLGLLWFDDTLGHFKRSPQPWFVDGLMISYPKDWMARHREGRKNPYDLLPPVLSDVYTGRVLTDEEAARRLPDLPKRDLAAPQPNQYRPPYQTDDWKSKKPVPGERINPLTGEKEPRTFPKSYGCDGGVDYGEFYTMRSGTAAFYDKLVESGTCHISGPRSGCTNSVIPACGLMNVPYFYEGCTCAYPLPCGLALVNMPETYEQWATWGEGKPEKIQRVGINLGAPGDRMTREGTLWLDYPSRGGPSLEVKVDVQPETAEYFYRHSIWMEGGTGWPWVAASGVEGARSITVSGFLPGKFTVRLCFVEPESKNVGERMFDISLNGRTVAEGYDIVKSAEGPMRGTTLEFHEVPVEETLVIGFVPRKGLPILSGIEVVMKRTRP